MLPQLLHPAHLHLNSLDDLLATSSFTFWEFEHLLIVDEFTQSFLLILDDLLELGDPCETALHASIVEVERFTLQANLHLL